jgi:hypothetical protein
VESEQLDNYHDGLHSLFVLAMYHVHVARRMFDEVVRFYIFNFLCYDYNVN